jgi:hypothetical protein
MESFFAPSASAPAPASPPTEPTADEGESASVRQIKIRWTDDVCDFARDGPHKDPARKWKFIQRNQMAQRLHQMEAQQRKMKKIPYFILAGIVLLPFIVTYLGCRKLKRSAPAKSLPRIKAVVFDFDRCLTIMMYIRRHASWAHSASGLWADLTDEEKLGNFGDEARHNIMAMMMETLEREGIMLHIISMSEKKMFMPALKLVGWDKFFPDERVWGKDSPEMPNGANPKLQLLASVMQKAGWKRDEVLVLEGLEKGGEVPDPNPIYVREVLKMARFFWVPKRGTSLRGIMPPDENVIFQAAHLPLRHHVPPMERVFESGRNPRANALRALNRWFT